MKNIKHWGKRKAEDRYAAAILRRDVYREHLTDAQDKVRDAKERLRASKKGTPVYAVSEELLAFWKNHEDQVLHLHDQATAGAAAAHPENVVPDLEGSPGRLPYGSGWGVWVEGWEFNPGDTVKVSTKRGKTWISEILSIVRLKYTENNEPLALCIAEKIE